MNLRVKILGLLLATVLIGLLVSAPAQALGPLESDGDYAALVNYVDFLQQRKFLGTNLTQKQSYGVTLANLAANAFTAVDNRSITRVNETRAANRAALAVAQTGLTAQYNSDAAEINQPYEDTLKQLADDYNTSLVDFQKQLQGIIADRQQQLKNKLVDLQDQYQNKIESVNSSWGAAINKAKRLYNKNNHRFGKNSKKTRAAAKQLQNQLDGKAQDVAAAKKSYNNAAKSPEKDYASSVAEANTDFNSHKKDLLADYTSQANQTKAQQKVEVDALTVQYNADKAQTQANYDAAWGDAYAQCLNAYNSEYNTVKNRQYIGSQFILSMRG